MRKRASTFLFLCFTPLLPGATGSVVVTVPAGTVVFAKPQGWNRLPTLKPGTKIDGTVEYNVAVGGNTAIPAGSPIRATVKARLKHERRRGIAGYLAAAAQFAWDPMSVQNPSVREATLQDVSVTLPNGEVSRLHASLANAIRVKSVAPEAKRSDSGIRLVFELNKEVALSIPEHAGVEPVTVAALPEPGIGVRAKLFLLGGLNGNKVEQGESFHAALVEPVKLQGGSDLPCGLVFEGKIIRSQPSRILRRGGNLHIGFTRLVFPNGETKDISGYVSEVDEEKSQKLSLSSEGAISGGPVGWKATVTDLALSYTVGKVTDDLVEEGIKAVLTSTSSAAAASAARYFGFGAGLAWFFAHRGRPADLPQYTILEVTFNRPVPAHTREAEDDIVVRK